MRIELTPRVKYVCDRCGKSFYDEYSLCEVAFYELGYNKNIGKRGEVCYQCHKDFGEIAGNFFDEVNKESEDTE